MLTHLPAQCMDFEPLSPCRGRSEFTEPDQDLCSLNEHAGTWEAALRTVVVCEAAVQEAVRFRGTVRSSVHISQSAGQARLLLLAGGKQTHSGQATFLWITNQPCTEL